MNSKTNLKIFDNSNEVRRWFSEGGDNKFRYDYNLNPNSVVFDVGGYEGKWSEKIYSMYNSKIYIFEPVKKYYESIKEKFLGNNNIKVYNFGLSNKTSKTQISLIGDGSSFFTESNTKEEVEMVDILEFIKDNNIENIDLLKLNVEGSEYDLLEHIIESNNLINIKNLQIQFHNFIENAVTRRDKIRNKLLETHHETYCFEFVWENWKKI